jgi:hypothetical protein
MKNIFFAAVMSVSVLLPGIAEAQTDPKCEPSILTLMSPEEFGAAGLAALSSEQLEALSAWVQARERHRAAATGGEPIVESRIDGDFDGWEGQTTFKLENGQVWQQARPSARYHFATAPKVVITTAYKMRVEGVAGEVAVRRIK